MCAVFATFTVCFVILTGITTTWSGDGRAQAGELVIGLDADMSQRLRWRVTIGVVLRLPSTRSASWRLLGRAQVGGADVAAILPVVWITFWSLQRSMIWSQ